MMKYKITSTEPDFVKHLLIIKAVPINSSDTKEEEATVKGGDDLIRLLAVFEVSHYKYLIGKEIGDLKDDSLQASVDSLLILD